MRRRSTNWSTRLTFGTDVVVIDRRSGRTPRSRSASGGRAPGSSRSGARWRAPTRWPTSDALRQTIIGMPPVGGPVRGDGRRPSAASASRAGSRPRRAESRTHGRLAWTRALPHPPRLAPRLLRRRRARHRHRRAGPAQARRPGLRPQADRPQPARRAGPGGQGRGVRRGRTRGARGRGVRALRPRRRARGVRRTRRPGAST